MLSTGEERKGNAALSGIKGLRLPFRLPFASNSMLLAHAFRRSAGLGLRRASLSHLQTQTGERLLIRGHFLFVLFIIGTLAFLRLVRNERRKFAASETLLHRFHSCDRCFRAGTIDERNFIVNSMATPLTQSTQRRKLL
jgi:hypothetical protein